MNRKLKFCPCCKKAVTETVFENHLEKSRTQVEADVAKLAILGSSPAPSTPATNGRPQDSLSSRQPGSPAQPKSPNVSPAGTTSINSTRSAGQTSHRGEDPRALSIFKELRVIETEIIKRCEALQSGALLDLSNSVRGRPSGSRKALLAHVRNEHRWMLEQKQRLKGYEPCLDTANREFATAIVASLEQQLETLKDVLEPLLRKPPNIPVYDTGRYFSDSIYMLPPATLIVVMMAVVLSLLAKVARGPCNFILRMSSLAIQAATQDPDVGCDIPKDIRTARKYFDLDPAVTIYAVCSCGKLHQPTSTSPFPIYPASCGCGAKLTRVSGHHNGLAIRKPIRPFVMQSFTDHRARMYSRPGYEAIMRRENILRAEGNFVSDIRDAKAYRDLKGPDGRPFVDCPTEIRMVWALSYDGYNPGSNKTAGKTASVGSLAMSCLSLPPSLRNRPENLYLVGLIPGPKQPSEDGLNPFVAPLVDDLRDAYHTGTFFSETYEHPEGITSREALLTVVNDLPGARKLVGGAGHSASVFCMYCYVLRIDINNIDMSSEAWTMKTGEAFRKAAEEWRDATSASKRKELYKRNGVRWSELLRLDYWNPVQNTVIDGMHNLFLGIVRHHFREVIGTHWDIQAAEASPESPREKDLKRGRHLLDTGEATLARLERLPRVALHQLCMERAVSPEPMPGKKLRKRQFVIALLRTIALSKTEDGDHETRIHNLEEMSVPDIFSIDLGEGPTHHVRRELLDTDDLKRIQDDIKRTFRPVNQTPPPRNFGSPSHGKLKADEWRACIEFDLPVSLVKLWAGAGPEGVEADPDASLRYAVSHRTSASHRERYLCYMHKYLQTLLVLHPNDNLHPNHHNALHLPTFLELFGPIPGWWMFPFERLIGILQRYNTNFKFGELEETVIKTFCASSHLKTILDRPPMPSEQGLPPTVFQQSLSIIHQCLPDSVKGTMLEGLESTERAESSEIDVRVLDQDIVAAFPDGSLQGIPVHIMSKIKREGRVFTPQSASRSHSSVFFRREGESFLRPGVIREIFEHGGTTYLVLQPHETKYVSFFDRFPDFGAEVWSQKLCSCPVVISLTASVYASYVRAWDTDKFVLKPVIPDF